MNTNSSRIEYLWHQFVAKTATRPEIDELTDLLATGDHDPESLQILYKNMESASAVEVDKERWTPVVEAILRPAEKSLSSSRLPDPPAARRSPVRGIVRFVMGTAAGILLALGVIHLFRSSHNSTGKTTVASADLRPGGNKATLMLDNGVKINLDSSRNGQLAEQGGMSVHKIGEGKLTYQPESGSTGTGRPIGSPSYNTLTTPRGGQYQLRLPDGTGAWLNAASSITFPTAFVGKERRVTISGEVYFEVAADASKPFLVTTSDKREVVEVLGTNFNINAYSDNGEIRTTLLNGGIKVTAKEYTRVVRPGQQTVVDDKELRFASVADLEAVMAWKNGMFQFNDVDITSVMRQLSRWYDVDIRYEGQPAGLRFDGRIPRDANISQVLRILETNQVHFRVEGRTIVVLP